LSVLAASALSVRAAPSTHFPRPAGSLGKNKRLKHAHQQPFQALSKRAANAPPVVNLCATIHHLWGPLRDPVKVTRRHSPPTPQKSLPTTGLPTTTFCPAHGPRTLPAGSPLWNRLPPKRNKNRATTQESKNRTTTQESRPRCLALSRVLHVCPWNAVDEMLLIRPACERLPGFFPAGSLGLKSLCSWRASRFGERLFSFFFFTKAHRQTNPIWREGVGQETYFRANSATSRIATSR